MGGLLSRAVILSAVRTPIGRYAGVLAETRPDDLAAIAVRAAVERACVRAEEVEDVFLGCANQAGEDNRNVARMAVLLAGLPQSVPGVTVNRLCASGLSAVVEACRAVLAGEGDLFVAGGVESMSRAPLALMKSDRAWGRGNVVAYDTHLGWRFPNPLLEAMFPLESMGETGENVAERYGVSREEQDAFALESTPLGGGTGGRPLRRRTRSGGRRCSGRASAAGNHSGEAGRDGTGLSRRRYGHGRECERRQRRCRRARGRVQEKARSGAEPLGRFVASAAARVDPRVMGIGPVPAVRKLLERTAVSPDELDLIELDEAFASQALAVIRELGIDMERVNVNGGAIALGHPLGMSGARLVASLLHELRRRGGRYGLATLCVGVGQGQAALFTR